VGEAFFGLNVAVRGLFSAQRNLNTVNHNLNNINTPGYTRQQAIQVASRPMALADGTGMMGTGSDVIGVRRIRDEYLDFKYWSENLSLGEWSAKKEALADIEVTFNEPSDSGFTAIMSDFYDSLQELAKDPSSAAVRALVMRRGETLAKFFNNMAIHFEELQKDINYRIQTKVEEINSIATQIQQLNRQIYITELDGNTANDMRDQRTLLVDKLSRLINIEANEIVAGHLPDGREDKHFVITISGKALVDHFSISKLALVQRDASRKVNFEDVDNLYDVRWEDGNQLKIKSGELRGYLDVRDGNEGSSDGPNGIQSPNYKGIPYYQRKLNEFVRTFARAFNEGYLDTDSTKGFSAGDTFGTGHAHGYGYGPAATDGIRFFTIIDRGQPMSSADFVAGAVTSADIYNLYNGMTAKNFTISRDILDDFNLIAASSAPGEAGNIEVLNQLLAYRRNDDMFAEGAPEDFMKSLVATLGIDTEQAGNYENNQRVVVDQIFNRRLSESGVSLDEEMANLVKFQHAYNAAAKMIQTMSEIYDTLVNKLFA
jgi:flagellar hook-associated protein 1 FlgK